MKIVLLGTAYPYRGGLASYNERMARQFIDEGDDVEIVTFTLQYPKLFFRGKSQYTNAPAPKDLSIRRMLSSLNPFSWIKTAKYIARLKPDMLLIRYWHPAMAPAFVSVARIAKRRYGKLKTVCIFDNVIPHESKPGYELLTRYFTGCIDGAVVMSHSVGEDLKRFRADMVPRFNRHPIFDNYGEQLPRDEALKRMGLSQGYTYLLFFGFIREYKGLDLLLKAFSDKRLRNRNIKLIVAGEFYEDEAPYRQIIADNGIAGDVILLNWFIAEDEVAALFSAANLVVQPYKSATQSGVTQIAYHFGKPMIVTDVGGLSEIVPDGKCGYVVKPNPESIADAIDDYLANDRETMMSENVEREKKRYSWDKLTATLRDIVKTENKNDIRK